MRLFGKASVGLEFDSSEARVVEMSGTSTSPKLVGCASIGLPEGAVKDGIIAEPEKVSELLKELWNKNGIKTKEVILGVSNQDVLVRFATFPKVSEDRLDNLIRYQAQDFLPMPINTVVLDYIVINSFTNNEGNFMEVLLVAAKKTMLESYLTCIEMAGLIPKDIDISSLTLWRMLPESDLNGVTAVVNLASEMINILLLAKGAPRLARALPISIKAAFSDKSYLDDNISYESTPRYTSEELESLVEDLSSGIMTSINYYYVQNSSQPINKIVICGFGVGIEGLVDKLKENLEIPIFVLNPLSKVAMAKEYKSIDETKASRYIVSLSLALRGLEG